MNTTIWIIQSLMAVLFVLHGIAMFNPPPPVRESVIMKMGYSLPFLKIIGTLEVFRQNTQRSSPNVDVWVNFQWSTSALA